MTSNVARSRPAGVSSTPSIETDPDLLARVGEDAAHYPGGHASGLAMPRDAGEVAALLALGRPVLVVGAQSSLTGGATPFGELVLSTGRLNTMVFSGRTVRAGAGVTLQALQEELAKHDVWFPPAPTYLGATVGGAVSTNAAGAATFKYGSVRDWVEGLTVVLANGHVLEIARGAVTASASGVIRIEAGAQVIDVPVAPLPLPDVPKRSAGYPLAAGMDLVDLFIGAEGTLGVVVDATLRVQPRPGGTCWAMVPVPSEELAITIVDDLRRVARATWAGGDAFGLDTAAIEHLDRRSLDIVREDGALAKLDISVPPDTQVILLVQIELSKGAARGDLWAELADALSPEAAPTPLASFCRLLDTHGVLDNTEIALPDQARRAAQFIELREAVPAGVNRRVALAKAQIDPRISKTAADMIVPVHRFGEMMRTCRALFAERGLDLAVWGHISDGNVHPNLVPTSFADVERARDAVETLGRAVVAMGGCPLAEHGVGRNLVKQQLLGRMYGAEGIEAMRRVKRSLDPKAQLAPGVLFPPQ